MQQWKSLTKPKHQARVGVNVVYVFFGLVSGWVPIHWFILFWSALILPY